MVKNKLSNNKTLFCDLVGYSPEMKVLELFLEGRNQIYSMSDVVNILPVNRKRAFSVLRRFVNRGLLVVYGERRGRKLYKLDLSNDLVKGFVMVFDDIVES